MNTKFSTVDHHSKIRVVFKGGYSHEVWVKGIVFDDDGQIGWEHIHDHNEFLEFVPNEILCIVRIKYKKVRQWHILQGLRGLFSSTSSGVKTVSSNTSSGIKRVFSFIFNGIKKVVLGIINGVKKIVLGTVNGIKKVVLGILNGIKRLVLAILIGIKNFFMAIWNGIKTIFSKIWANIKRLYFIVRKIRQMITKARRKLFGIR
tara:strand:+ start:388 stop:996 length:609 start_codon:yes stop_codon:yes gene_type:complete